MEKQLKCEHQERTPEAVEMTLEDSLEHFMKCLNRAQQLYFWQLFRDDGDVARRCKMNDHDGQVYNMQLYIMKLRNQLDGKN